MKNMNAGNREKLQDTVFGLAIGDALGVPYEFVARGAFECKGMTGHGSHDQPAGTWSDDTSMTIATVKSLRDRQWSVRIEDMKEKFISWMNEEAFLCNDTLFDIGIATSQALLTGIPQTDLHSNGNGSLMRILPLAFTDCSDDDIRAVSAITHGHEISQTACVIYVHVARRLLAGETMAEIIPTLEYEKPFDRLSKLDELTVDEIHSGGYVVDTLEASLWSLLGSHDFESAVLTAVNLGSDTDTTGAVTGGLAGIVYGLDSDFAQDCIKKLRAKEVIGGCLGLNVVRGDWKRSDMPQAHDTFILERAFTEDQMKALRKGHIPQAMEDKWFWYMEGERFYAHRSWTGYCLFIIHFSEDNHHRVTVNRDPGQYKSRSIDRDRRTLNRLLDWWSQESYDYYLEWLGETLCNLKKGENIRDVLES